MPTRVAAVVEGLARSNGEEETAAHIPDDDAP
jgi:hypothetical protein